MRGGRTIEGSEKRSSSIGKRAVAKEWMVQSINKREKSSGNEAPK